MNIFLGQLFFHFTETESVYANEILDIASLSKHISWSSASEKKVPVTCFLSHEKMQVRDKRDFMIEKQTARHLV